MTKTQWQHHGLYLSTALKSSMWALGDWYLAGKAEFGAQWCRSVVVAPDWRGIEYPTLLVYASIAKAFPPLIRIKDAAPALHQLCAPLPIDQALALLKQAVQENWNVNRMRIEVRRIQCFNPLVGGLMADDIAALIARGRAYRGLLADPPWEWDTTGGKAGATTPYYPSMTMDELCALPVSQVATDDAFLFLWCPPALLESAGLSLIRAWGFAYKVNLVWDKGNFGRGAYVRTAHEHLLVAVRPGSPTHFIDNSVGSVIRVPSTRHNSEKPVEAHRIVERAINGPYLELFARKHVRGWDCFGNQLAKASPTIHLLTPSDR
jgi:N6-adenosine-specific RNA methylase IME4